MARHLPTRLSRPEARRFGVTVGAAFLVLAAITWWRDRQTASAILSAMGAAFVVAGVLIPGVLPPVHRLWMAGAERLSRVTTPIILGVIYFVVITPVGMILRALGRDPLTGVRPGESVWVQRASTARRSDLRRQF